VLPTFLEIGFTAVDHRFRTLIRVEHLPLFGRYGYVEMIKCLMIKTLLLCRSSAGVPVHSVYVRLFSGSSTVTYFMEVCVRLETIMRDTFSNIGGSIIYGLALRLLRRCCSCSL
jgi:hypothetical protein